MKKRNNKKGFTLAELLIVVAIIAVLVAIAIPVFTAQLERSREAVDAANIRAGYAEAMSSYISNGNQTAESTTTYTVKQETDGWASSDIDWTITNGTAPSLSGIKTYTVKVEKPASGDTPTVSIVKKS